MHATMKTKKLSLSQEKANSLKLLPKIKSRFSLNEIRLLEILKSRGITDLNQNQFALYKQNYKIQRIKSLLSGAPHTQKEQSKWIKDFQSKILFPKLGKAGSVKSLGKISQRNNKDETTLKKQEENRKGRRCPLDRPQRIQIGNQMFLQVQKLMTENEKSIRRSLSNSLRYEREQQKKQLEKIRKRKNLGNQYLRESLLELMTPLEQFMSEKGVEGDLKQRKNILRAIKNQKIGDLSKQWDRIIGGLVEGSVERLEGLMKLNRIQLQLEKLGVEVQEKKSQKIRILKQHSLL